MRFIKIVWMSGLILGSVQSRSATKNAVLGATTPVQAGLTRSSIDEWNTYQFNRSNYLKKNGKRSQSPWFEWWYYKVVLPENNKSFYFIYGVVNPWDLKQKNLTSRSYVGMGAFAEKQTLEQRFLVSDFSASYEQTSVAIGPQNRATDHQFQGAIQDLSGAQSQWNIRIEKKWAFNATSWATGKNITAIEWYPAQADARCSGEITLDGVRETFENAPCYQDRNWGSQFPEWWAWIVSNQFEGHPGTTLAAGGGKPTVFDHYQGIEGLAIGLFHEGIEYAFRPHDGHWVRFDIQLGQWNVEAINKKNRILISASAPRNQFMDLQFLTPQGKLYHDYETLTGKIHVQLFEATAGPSPWKLQLDLWTHQYGGLEFGSYESLEQNHLPHFQYESKPRQ